MSKFEADLPAGWRILQLGEALQLGDRFLYYRRPDRRLSWEPVTQDMVEQLDPVFVVAIRKEVGR